MNIKLRLQNWKFWATIAVGIFTMTCGFLNMEASDFSSWDVVYQALITVLANPYYIMSIVIYVFGCIMDTSTPGWSDSDVTKAKTNLNQTAEDVIANSASEATAEPEDASDNTSEASGE